MHACCPDGREGERWGSSIFVDQSQGQGSFCGPRSRWMEASDGSSLTGCPTRTGPHQPTAFIFSVSTFRDSLWKCSSTGIGWTVWKTASSTYRDICMLTHQHWCVWRDKIHNNTLHPSKSLQKKKKEAELTSELVCLWRKASQPSEQPKSLCSSISLLTKVLTQSLASDTHSNKLSR